MNLLFVLNDFKNKIVLLKISNLRMNDTRQGDPQRWEKDNPNFLIFSRKRLAYLVYDIWLEMSRFMVKILPQFFPPMLPIGKVKVRNFGFHTGAGMVSRYPWAALVYIENDRDQEIAEPLKTIKRVKTLMFNWQELHEK